VAPTVRSAFGKQLWFLFGEQLLVTGVIAMIAPGAYVIWLLRDSKYWTAFLIGVAWLPLFLFLVITMHRKGIVRIWVSLSATAAVLLAFTIVIFEVM
jgi:hypothetical protein